jgi:hypothetical protein
MAFIPPIPMLIRSLLTLACACLLPGSGQVMIPGKADHGADPYAYNTGPVNDVRLAEALAYCRKSGHDTLLACFADMSIHSGKKRFFVYDLQEKRLLKAGLCCHGMGKGSSCESPVFSNERGSNCTSLGRYRIGERAYSTWGIHIHYKLHGLEPSNSNAFSRTVVLHSYDPVPDEEIWPEHLPMGWSLGCPVVSNSLLRELDILLKRAKRPVLLWIYR